MGNYCRWVIASVTHLLHYNAFYAMIWRMNLICVDVWRHLHELAVVYFSKDKRNLIYSGEYLNEIFKPCLISICKPQNHEGSMHSQHSMRMIEGSNIIVCVLLVSNSRGCCLAAPGDHEGAARVIAPRQDNTRESLTPTIHTQSCLIPIITWCHRFFHSNQYSAH